MLVAYQATATVAKATVRYALTGAADVTLKVKPPKGAAVTVGKAKGKAGINRISWNRKLKGRKAGKGTYKLTITATAGGRSVASTVYGQAEVSGCGRAFGNGPSATLGRTAAPPRRAEYTRSTSRRLTRSESANSVGRGHSWSDDEVVLGNSSASASGSVTPPASSPARRRVSS